MMRLSFGRNFHHTWFHRPSLNGNKFRTIRSVDLGTVWFSTTNEEKKNETKNSDGTFFPQAISGRSFFMSEWEIGTLKSLWTRRNIDLNFSFNDWERHESPTRHFRHLSLGEMWRSSTFRRMLFPDLFAVAATSSFVTYWNLESLDDYKYSAHDVDVAGNIIELHQSMMTLPTIPFTISAFALGLLVTFRTQSGNARYVRARQDWGAMINVCRDLVSRVTNRYPKGDAQSFAVKLVATFPYTVMYHLTKDGANTNLDLRGKTDVEIEELKSDSLRQLLTQKIWINPNERDLAFIDGLLAQDVKNRPLFCLNELRRTNVQAGTDAIQTSGTDIRLTIGDPVVSSGLDDRILDLMNALGSCERILRTPIYTSYTRHASRFLTLWCNALPMALYPLVGPTLTVPFSLVISFVMFGLEDIGIRVEQPFNILPLWQYCETIEASCNQVTKQHK